LVVPIRCFKMVTKLSDLDIEEVSLVDVPANNKRVIFKSLNKGDKMARITKEDKLPPMPPIPGKKPEDEEDEEGLEEAGIPKEKHPIAEAAGAVATEHMDAAEAAKHKAELAEHAAEAAMAVAEAAEAAAEAAGAEEQVPEEPIMDAAPEIMPPEEGGEPQAEGDDEEEGEEPDMEKSDDEDEDDMEEEKKKACIGKGKDRKPAEKKGGKKPKVEVDLHKALADRDAKIAILEKAAKDANEKLVMKEYVEKSQKEFGHIPGVSSEQFGAVLKNASEKMDASQYQTLITVLKSVESMLSQSVLTQTIGVKAEARLMDGTAASRLHQKATDIMNTVQKSGDKLTYEKAFVRAMKEAPELYNEYLQGK
jgi:hypothetical protein